ncbi:tRNA (5-methylaminomethyl-2-thiouridine)(34)-methyltransferase MnmD [Hydrogenimonas sp.]
MKQETEPTLVETEDGSFTARSALFDECYHSTKDGALRESLKKHVEPAFQLADRSKKRLRILDICFGLGYNTLATLYHLEREGLTTKLQIFSPEFDESLVRSLAAFPYPEELEPYRHVVESIAATGRYEGEGVGIEVVFGDARSYLRSTAERFDIVYQDAFSPKKNPLLWTKEYFGELTERLAPDGVITTYSSATPVRLGMVENGLYIYRPPEAPVRPGTIASPRGDLPLEPIDMALKRERNPSARPLSDMDFK